MVGTIINVHFHIQKKIRYVIKSTDMTCEVPNKQFIIMFVFKVVHIEFKHFVRMSNN